MAITSVKATVQCDECRVEIGVELEETDPYTDSYGASFEDMGLKHYGWIQDPDYGLLCSKPCLAKAKERAAAERQRLVDRGVLKLTGIKSISRGTYRPSDWSI